MIPHLHPDGTLVLEDDTDHEYVPTVGRECGYRLPTGAPCDDRPGRHADGLPAEPGIPASLVIAEPAPVLAEVA